MRKVFSLFLLIGLCLAVGKLWYWRTDGFQVSRLQGWTQQLPGTWWDEEAETAIAQDYHYLGRGRQAFAFASADGRYVIKFPRGDICKLPFWLRALPIEFRRKRQIFRKARNEKNVLESARLAMTELKEATAVLGMNFSPNGCLKGKTVRIFDKAGRRFTISLSSSYFVLQRKKELFRDVIQTAALQEGLPGVEKVLDALFVVIVERTQKGILNRDGSFLRNYGYDEMGAYQTDVGSFYQVASKPTQELYHRSMELSVKPIRRWMKANHPEWLELLEKKRTEYSEQFTH